MWSLGLAVFAVGVAVGVLGEDAPPLTFDPPASCNSHNFTWSSASLSCVKCSVPNCKTGKCGNGLAWVDDYYYGSSQHEQVCLPCGVLNPYDSNTGVCSPCPSGHIRVIREITGSLLNATQCVKCNDGFVPSDSGLSCVPCHSSFISGSPGSCSCPEISHSEIGGICFPVANMSGEPTFDKKHAYRLHFDKSAVESPLLKEHLLAAFYQCKDSLNLTACEVLTNLCVLDMGSFSSDDWTVCRLLRTLSSTSTRIPIPLYYYSEAAASLLARADAIPHVHTTSHSLVNISVTKWSLNGTFLGLSDLEEILPCSMPRKLMRVGRHFGTNFRLKCDIDFTDINKPYQFEFLHPFLSYNDEDSLKKGQYLLYPVPLKVMNFNKNGKKVNQGDDQFSWQLVRRFFIADAVSTRNTDEKLPKVFRYLKSLDLKVTLQNSPEAGKIYVPLLTATYGELSGSEAEQRRTVSFTYSVTYSMDMSRSLEDIKISVGVLSSLAVLWGAIETWAWTRRNGRLELDFRTLFTFLSSCSGNLADAFALVCLSTGTFWVVFYKKQAAVHVFLPETCHERLIRDLLISAFALKIVEIAQLIYRQCTISLFLIDWERPKAPAQIAPTGTSKSSNNNQTPSVEVISIWRTYFIANEWNELQTFRKTHVPTQLLASLTLLEVFGFKWIALHTTQSEHYSESYELLSTTVPFSTVARIVVGTGVYLAIGVLQWIFRRLTWHSSHPLHAFVDLCSLANVSVWGMSARLHGFYIHGRSVHGFADTDMGTMVEQLSREEEDLCGRRGLVPQTDTQTFTISVPAAFRSVYDALLPVEPPTGIIIPKTVFGTGRNRRMPLNASTNVSSASLTARLTSYGCLTRFLCAFLDHALSDLDYEVVNKSLLEQTLRIELTDLPPDRAFFYNDESGHSSFDSVLFFGHERSLFLFNMYCFVFMDMMTHNYVMAASFVLILDVIAMGIRNAWGKNNLARKTLIDRRFLI